MTKFAVTTFAGILFTVYATTAKEAHAKADAKAATLGTAVMTVLAAPKYGPYFGE